MQTLPRFASTSLSLPDPAYVSCDNSDAALSFTGTQPFTVEAWIWLEDASVDGVIVAKDVTGESNPAYLLGVMNGELFGLRYDTHIAHSSRTLTAETWHHVAMTYDGSTLTIYIDGYSADSRGETTPIPSETTASPMYIGRDETLYPTWGFPGQIGRVSVWSSCRTVDQVVGDSAQWEEHRVVDEDGTPTVSYDNPDLLAAYTFSNLPAVDVSGNNRGFSLEGSARFALIVPALTLDGTSAYAEISPSLSLGGDLEFTIEGWFAPAAGGSGVHPGTIVANYVSGIAASYAVRINGDGQLTSYRNLEPWEIIAPPPLEPGTFYHFATTYDGTTLRLFINGNLQTSLKLGEQSTNSYPALIGAVWASTQLNAVTEVFEGSIQSVRFWDEALEAKAIRQWMYNDPVISMNQPGDPELMAAFDFSVDPPIDTTGNYQLTLHGGAAVDLTTTLYVDAVNLPFGFLQPVVNVDLDAEPLDTVDDLDFPQIAGVAQAEPFSDAFYEQLRTDLVDTILPQVDEARRAETLAGFETAYAEAAKRVQANPDLLRPLTTKRENGLVQIIHHSPAGDEVVFQALDAEVTDCQVAEIKLIATLSIGLFAAVGLIPSAGQVAGKVAKVVLQNAAAMSKLAQVIAVPLTVVSLLGFVTVLYDNGLLWSIIKILFISAGWWALVKILARILTICFPPSGYATVATVLAGFIIWVAQSGIAAAEVFSKCPD